MQINRSCALILSFFLITALLPAQDSNRRGRSKAPATEKSAAETRVKPLTGTTTQTASISETTTTETASHRAGAMKHVDPTVVLENQVKSIQLSSDPDIRIGYLLEAPTPWYDFDGTTLSWREVVPGETHYLLVTIQDAADGRLIPGCKVIASLADGSGKDVITSISLTETWDPGFHHYGTNINLPAGITSGTLNIKADPPLNRRRDKVLGAFFREAAKATFPDIRISTSTIIIQHDHSAEPEKAFWKEGRRPYVEPTPYPGSDAAIKR